METTTVSTPDILQVKEALAKAFPNYKVKPPFFNKKMIHVVDGLRMAIVVQNHGQLKATRALNIMHPWAFIVFVLLMAFTLVGGLIFYFIIHQRKKDEIIELEEEVNSFLSVNYQQIK